MLTKWPWFQCWINDSYELLRLLTHYIFIILALVATACLYLAIFASIRRRQALTDQTSHLPSDVQSQLQMSRNPVFLIYPVIYILCTLPLALGRVASVAGAAVPLGYMCFAGAMIAANGMFDCILFSTTRKAILFADKCDISLQETGLQTFAFMQTPKTRRYGNMVWIQGGQGAQTGWGPAKDEEATNGPWSRRNRGYPSKGYQRTESPRVSQERLRGRPAIQMDTVTSVVVEDDHDKDTDGGYTNQSAGSSIMEEPRASHHSL